MHPGQPLGFYKGRVTRNRSAEAVLKCFTDCNAFCTKNVLAGIAACYEHGAFSVKASQGSYELDEDYEAAAKIWSEFGVSR